MNHPLRAVGLLALAATLSACGASAPTTDGGAGGSPAAGTCLEGTPDCGDADLGAPEDTPPVAGMCAPEVPECVDTVVVEPGESAGVGFDDRAATAHAQALLGLTEDELDRDEVADVRVGRRGEELMALTQDYLLGRMTVALDLDDNGDWVVTAVTVELTDAPQTFTRHLG